MTYPDIRSLVPHSGQMMLLDRVLDAGDDTLSAEVEITRASVFCDGAVVGSWVGIEYMAQAVAAQAGYVARLRGEPVKIGFLLGARRYVASVPAFGVGTVLHVHVKRALLGENGLGAFECRIDDAASGATVATATVTVFQPNDVNDFLQRSDE